ncbi:hypothetical protein VTK73DRAFT_8715 [Phialemonium thermophilum]|uniref:Major facilitator superfamily (MFS) profile domain-containing protein n=1 Tax=Phialemonium thermophilum TaxID=223376 RepID=A0ABR3XP28_9PEZI
MATKQGLMVPANDAGSRSSAGNAVDENSPLLGQETRASQSSGDEISETPSNEVHGGYDGGSSNDKPLPKFQVGLLCYARVVEPMAFFCIFPYISQMAQENGHLADADVGFYSGLIESLFSLTQMVVMIFWGRASDRIGRKPVLVFSLAGVTIATAIFGLARTIGQMILFRCLSGVFAGTIVTLRTMIAEHSTSKTQARAFSWFAFTGNLGLFLGPLLGGALADPARLYPSLFGRIQFFIDYPYALPTFAVAAISLSAVVLTIVYVEETLVRTEKKNLLEGMEALDAEQSASTKTSQAPSIWRLLRSPEIAMALFVYGYVMLLAFAYTAVTPVFWFTPVPLGGFGLQPAQISALMAVNGFAQAIWTLVAFPPLQHRLGTTGLLRVCAVVWPIFFAVNPLLNLLLRTGARGAATAFWTLVVPSMAVGCGVSMSFTAVQLAVNDIAPDPTVLGTLNALALTGTSGIRAFAPALFTSLFAVGARTQWIFGYLFWAVMVALAIVWTVMSRYLPDYDEVRRQRERRQRDVIG